jgi:hypothetical protein
MHGWEEQLRTVSERQREDAAGAAPRSDDWRERWRRAGRPWRTEPPIADDRRQFLLARRAVVPDIQRGIYPFKDVHLNRVDVEWLLAEALAERDQRADTDDASADGHVNVSPLRPGERESAAAG